MAIKPIQVSQLNRYIGQSLKLDPLLSDVLVVGEISNLKYHTSGHVYFDLKDERSRLRCFLGSWNKEHLRYELEDGMEVQASGGIQVYEAGGYYSLAVTDVEACGQGDLAIAFEALKKKLAGEGLFDPDRKKEIPAYPARIAVVTAETGAAIKDILSIITGKNDLVDILIVPVLVQGPEAAGKIASALALINEKFGADQQKQTPVDTIILGRGGGSMEDLWAFNEETVARAISDSVIPIISAVGHETDVTIADLVSDLRAETPTAAAHLAVPDSQELRRNVRERGQDLLTGLEELCREKEGELAMLDLDRLGQIIDQRVAYENVQARRLSESMGSCLQAMVQRMELDLVRRRGRVEAASPLRIMERGYVALTDEKGRLIRRLAHLNEQDRVTLTGADGMAHAIIKEVRTHE